ncbi:MAG: hypothetical protein EON98_04840 [Chitinophagaceae bacterium]|nr:MAG: hypothetical protein EON98_04840 [Chitinophagaceae bacterium]
MSAAVIVAVRNRYIRTFRKVGAVDEVTAIVPSEHGIRESLIFKGLVRRGIIMNAGGDRYFLNEVVEAADRKRRQTIVLVLFILIFLLLIFFFRR